MVPAFLAETVETGNKPNKPKPLMFCKESLGLERNGPVHELYRLKALITLEQVNTLVVEKKK